jgi:hypothetical protein
VFGLNRTLGIVLVVRLAQTSHSSFRVRVKVGTEGAMSNVINQTLQLCDGCGRVRESDTPQEDREEHTWRDVSSFLEGHVLHGANFKLTRAHCPNCFHASAGAGPAAGDEERDDDESFTTYGLAPITRLVLHTIGNHPGCSLDALVQACLPYTWNQILLEIDRLSRRGDIRLTLSFRGRYTLQLSSRWDHAIPPHPSCTTADAEPHFPTQSNLV